MNDLQIPVSLLSLEKGKRARIVKVSNGTDMSRLMLSHGLRIGSVINILQQRRRGVVIGSGAIRIALGADMAKHLLVEYIDD